MRADARRNRQAIVAAAIELILEVGGAPTRDAVAERAGVGIGTLYRHFPESHDLLRAAVVEVLDRAVDAGRAALAGSGNGGDALAAYLHSAVDLGLGVVNIVYPVLADVDWPHQRAAAGEMLAALVAAAVSDGALDPAESAADIGLASIRFCRPLAIGLAPADDRAIAHRQLDRYLRGLMPTWRATTPDPAG